MPLAVDDGLSQPLPALPVAFRLRLPATQETEAEERYDAKPSFSPAAVAFWFRVDF